MLCYAMLCYAMLCYAMAMLYARNALVHHKISHHPINVHQRVIDHHSILGDNASILSNLCCRALGGSNRRIYVGRCHLSTSTSSPLANSHAETSVKSFIEWGFVETSRLRARIVFGKYASSHPQLPLLDHGFMLICPATLSIPVLGIHRP